jgi:hypothetical protein
VNDIKVYVNFKTFVIVTTIWVILLLTQLIMSIIQPGYVLPSPLMNILLGASLPFTRELSRGQLLPGAVKPKPHP